MTVLSTSPDRLSYPGNDLATVFPGPRLFNESELGVYEVDNITGASTLKTSPAYYSLSIGTNTSTVTTVVAVASGKTLLLLRTMELTQDTSFKNQGSFFPELHEDAFDKLTLIGTQLATGISRSLRLYDTDTDGSGRYNADGNRIVSLATADGTTMTDAANVQAVINLMAAYIGSGSATLATLASTLTSQGTHLISYNSGVTDPATQRLDQRLQKTMFLTDFDGVTGSSADDQKVGLNKALLWAMQNGGVLLGKAGDVYACNNNSWFLTGDGSTTQFILSSGASSLGLAAVVGNVLNLWVRVCPYSIKNSDGTTSKNFNANSGTTLRPGTDFTYDPATQTVTFVSAPARALFYDNGLPDNTTGQNIQIMEGLNIQASHVVLDGQGCRFTGTARVEVPGAPTVAGQEPPLANIHIRRYRSEAAGSFSCPVGPRLSWCRNSSIEDITKSGVTGTGFNLHMCWDSHILGCKTIGSGAGAIGALLFHCRDCSIQNHYFSDLAGAANLWGIGVQVKGGYGNRVVNCSAHNITDDNSLHYVYLTRGDAPWQSNGTFVFGIYPYPTGAWLAADPQRASRDVVWERCNVSYDSTFAGLKFAMHSQAQEFVRVTYRSCKSLGAGSFKVNRIFVSPDIGMETDARYYDCDVVNGIGPGFQAVGGNNGATDYLLPGLAYSNCTVSGCTGDGFNWQRTDTLSVTDCTVDSATVNGFYSVQLGTGNKDPHLFGVSATNCTGTGILLDIAPNTDRGAYIGRLKKLSGNGTNITIKTPCTTDRSRVALGIATTTDATIATLQTLTIPDGTHWDVESVLEVADTTNSLAHRFRTSRGATSAAGTAAAYGAQNSIEAFNPTGLGGATHDFTSQTNRIRYTGKAATNTTAKLTQLICKRLD